MFDSAGVVRPFVGHRDRAPGDTLSAENLDDRLDAVLERLLDDEPVQDRIPEWVPAWVDDPPSPTYGTCTPSGFLALELDTGTTDPARLGDDDLIEAIVGFDRINSWAAARQARHLAELARRRPTDKAPHTARNACVGSEFAPDEVGVALHLSRGVAADRIGMARHLLTALPATFALWEAGRIDTAKARAIHDATLTLTPELTADVETRIIAKAPDQTLSQLRASLGRAIVAADPDGAEARHTEALKDRRVYVQAEADGMGSLWALLTATDAAGAFAWLTRLARGLGADDPRSMDTRRADLLAALLNGRLVTDADITLLYDQHGEQAADEQDGHEDTADGPVTGSGPGAGGPVRPVTPGKPLIQIVIGYSTLIGADDQPAELVGHGPIPASLAREVAAEGVWRRLVTDPLSGTVLDHGRTTYHPPAALADHIRARDVYCRFPGCRRRAADAELDHVVAWADGGDTSAENLRGLCLHHHRLKHHAGWRVEGHPDGRLTWITPTGHRHTTGPHDYRPEPPASPPTADQALPDADPDADPDPPPF